MNLVKLRLLNPFELNIKEINGKHSKCFNLTIKINSAIILYYFRIPF